MAPIDLHSSLSFDAVEAGPGDRDQFLVLVVQPPRCRSFRRAPVSDCRSSGSDGLMRSAEQSPSGPAMPPAFPITPNAISSTCLMGSSNTPTFRALQELERPPPEHVRTPRPPHGCPPPLPLTLPCDTSRPFRTLRDPRSDVPVPYHGLQGPATPVRTGQQWGRKAPRTTDGTARAAAPLFP